jgi:hypothetical protein
MANPKIGRKLIIVNGFCVFIFLLGILTLIWALYHERRNDSAIQQAITQVVKARFEAHHAAIKKYRNRDYFDGSGYLKSLRLIDTSRCPKNFRLGFMQKQLPS